MDKPFEPMTSLVLSFFSHGRRLFWCYWPQVWEEACPSASSSLRPLVGKEKDRTLCPTGSLLTYMKRLEPVRGDRKLLFISPDPRVSKEISTNTIYSWISSLITYCHRQPTQAALELLGKTTHELRVYVSSLVHRGCWALEDVLQGSWKSNQVFVNHYLRDLSEQEGGLKR